MNEHAAATYRQTLERTLPQSDLLIRLYEGAIRCLDIMKEAIRTGDIPRRAEAVNRVTAILSELASAIDGQEPRDFSEAMVSLYVYMIQEVTLANVADEVHRLDPVRKLLVDLLGSWKIAAASRTPASPPRTGANVAGALPRTLSVRG